MHAHKRSLLIQSELGGLEYPMDEQYSKYRRTFAIERNLMFLNIHRLIRCVIDVQVYLQDAVGARHALELARSLSAGVWDNSPFQMKQMPNIGPVAIRKLALAGITSIEALEATEPHRIEVLLTKNPPFGSRLMSQLKEFPKLRVSVKNMSRVSSKYVTKILSANKSRSQIRVQPFPSSSSLNVVSSMKEHLYISTGSQSMSVSLQKGPTVISLISDASGKSFCV